MVVRRQVEVSALLVTTGCYLPSAARWLPHKKAIRSARKKLHIEQAATLVTFAPVIGRPKLPTRMLIKTRLPAIETAPFVILNFKSRRSVSPVVAEGRSFHVQR